MVERLTLGDSLPREGHEFRYIIAAGFVDYGTRIVDAACGTGYGMEILTKLEGYASYLGVDRDLSALEVNGRWQDADFVEADLNVWEPTDVFDLFVSFETIEHLADYSVLIANAKRSRRWAVLSVPVVPTKHVNRWHLHDFGPGDLCGLMAGDGWRHYQTVQQPSESSEISVFERVS